MLNHPGPSAHVLAAGFAAAMLVGILLSVVNRPSAEFIAGGLDPLVVLLIALVMATTRWRSVRELSAVPRTAIAILGLGLIIGPLLAWSIATFAPVDPVLALGIALFCLYPCTDWFLGFTRIAGGDTRTGAAVIPLSMAVQITAFPAALALLGVDSAPDFEGVGAIPALLSWFALPAALALTIRLGMRALIRQPESRLAMLSHLDRAIPLVIGALILSVFAGNGMTVVGEPETALVIAGFVLGFFVVMGCAAAVTARALRLPGDHATLVVISASARNAPLVMAMTAIALPDQPQIVTIIALGMVVEFPHLTALTTLLRRRAARRSAPSPTTSLRPFPWRQVRRAPRDSGRLRSASCASSRRQCRQAAPRLG